MEGRVEVEVVVEGGDAEDFDVEGAEGAFAVGGCVVGTDDEDVVCCGGDDVAVERDAEVGVEDYAEEGAAAGEVGAVG